MNVEIIKIADGIAKGLCVSAQDGEILFQRIKDNIDQGKKICLSFEGVTDLTSAFLNSAVGQLYGKYTDEQLKDIMLAPINGNPDDLNLLKRVVDRAKDFFKNPEPYKKAAEEELGDDGE
jgi:hypothetical protein